MRRERFRPGGDARDVFADALAEMTADEGRAGASRTSDPGGAAPDVSLRQSPHPGAQPMDRRLSRRSFLAAAGLAATLRALGIGPARAGAVRYRLDAARSSVRFEAEERFLKEHPEMVASMKKVFGG